MASGGRVTTATPGAAAAVVMWGFRGLCGYVYVSIWHIYAII